MTKKMEDKSNEEDMWVFEELADSNLQSAYESGWHTYRPASHPMLTVTPNGWRVHDEGRWWKPRRKPLEPLD